MKSETTGWAKTAANTLNKKQHTSQAALPAISIAPLNSEGFDAPKFNAKDRLKKFQRIHGFTLSTMAGLKRASLTCVGDFPENRTGKVQEKLHEHYIDFSQRKDMRLILDALEPKDRLNLMADTDRLKSAVKGNYEIKQDAPLDMHLQRAGMKSAAYDSMPKQAYLVKKIVARRDRAENNVDAPDTK